MDATSDDVGKKKKPQTLSKLVAQSQTAIW
jgi:hypothetical protein